jgi:hypothetical protein
MKKGERVNVSEGTPHKIGVSNNFHLTLDCDIIIIDQLPLCWLM